MDGGLVWYKIDKDPLWSAPTVLVAIYKLRTKGDYQRTN